MTPYPRYRTDLVEVQTCYTAPRLVQFGSQTVTFTSESEARNWKPAWADQQITVERPTTVSDGRTMDDFVVPKFKERLASGDIIKTNPMLYTNRILSKPAECTVVTKEVYKSGNSWKASWAGAHVARRVQPSIPSYSPAYGRMITEVRAKAATGFMDVLTSAAELGKTIQMIVGFKRRVREMIRDLVSSWATKRGRLSTYLSFGQVMTELSSYWLEFRYGWRILWYEYNSIVDVINAMRGDFVRRAFRTTEMMPTSESTKRVTVLNGSPVLLDFVSTEVRGGTARAGTTCRADIRTHVSIDPLVTAWELMPLTLVLDIFWNIGDVLAASSPFNRVVEEDVWTSLESSNTVYGDWDLRSVPSGREVYRFEPTGSFWFNQRRVREPAKPVAEFHPHVNMSWAKALDLGSLVMVLKDSVFLELRQRTKL